MSAGKGRFLSSPSAIICLVLTLSSLFLSLLFFLLSFVDVFLYRDESGYTGNYPPYLGLCVGFGALFLFSLIAFITLFLVFKKRQKEAVAEAIPRIDLSEEAADERFRPAPGVSLGQGEGASPLFEIKDYSYPDSFRFAFLQTFGAAPFVFIFILLIPILSLAFALLGQLYWGQPYLALSLYAETGVLVLLCLFLFLGLPNLVRKRARGFRNIRLCFYEDRFEISNLVHDRLAYLGEARIVVPYAGIRAKRNYSDCLFLLFLYQGKRSAIGLDKARFPSGLEGFLLSKIK